MNLRDKHNMVIIPTTIIDDITQNEASSNLFIYRMGKGRGPHLSPHYYYISNSSSSVRFSPTNLPET
jgi:hypothetical protein